MELKVRPQKNETFMQESNICVKKFSGKPQNQIFVKKVYCIVFKYFMRSFKKTSVYMKQKTSVGSPMGNCSTCFKVPAPGESQVIGSLEKGREGHDGDVHKCSLSAFEHQFNGNSRSLIVHENCGSHHRDKSLISFYSRIPSLGKNLNNIEGKNKEISDAKLLALYDNYKDSDSPKYILAEGVERFLSDLNLSPDEFKVLVLAWRLNAETMCQFSKDEFICGFKSMRCDSIRSISATLSEISKEVLRDPELFKDLYRFTFRFGLDKSSGERILPSDMAICLWKIVFSTKDTPILEKWLKFLESHPNIRGIPCDTWNMFLNLIDTIGHDLSSYDDSEAWPSIFDDFVEYENDQMNQNIYKEKDEIIQDWV